MKRIFENEPDVFLKFRNENIEKIEQAQLPFDTTKILRKWNLESLESTENLVKSDMVSFIEKDIENSLIIKDGLIVNKHVSNSFVGIEFYTYEDEIVYDLILKYFDFSINENKLNILNNAYLNSILFVKIPKGKSVDETLNIVVLTNDEKIFHTTFILAEESSNINIVEYISNNTEDSSFVTRFNALANSNLNYLSFDYLENGSKGFISKLGTVSKDANLTISEALLGEGNVLLDNKINLIEENAYCTMKTLSVANGNTINLVNSSIEHLASNTSGFIVNQGIAVDHSHITFNGIGKINNGMKHSVARQTTRGVVLDKESRLDANPFLLIDEYDVIASHGATIGKVDEEQLYYLMSRGLSKKDAEKLIVYGFLTPILKELKNEKLQELFMGIIDKKIVK